MSKRKNSLENKYVLISLAMVVYLAPAILVATIGNKRQEADSGKATTNTYSTSTPSEKKPGNTYKWRGGPTDPRKIIIPAIMVDAYVQNVGVDQNKQVAVPDNIYIAGWFVLSARPGQRGLSVIDGHVTGRRNNGVFKDLEKLKVGDVYSIEFGNGSKKKFKIIGKQSAPVDKAVSVIFSQNPKVVSQLNLVTCGGRFDDKTRSYSDRLTIQSEQI